MWKLIVLSLIQSLFTAMAQVTLKVATGKLAKFSFSWDFFKTVVNNIPLLISGVCALTSVAMWMYILKHWPFSIAYPLSTFAYVWGMIAAALILHEPIAASRWIGVALIVIGMIFIAK